MSFRKHMSRQVPHLMLSMMLGLMLMFAAISEDLLFM